MLLPLDIIHTELKSKTGLNLVRGGQDQETTLLPYIQYDNITEGRYKDYQILKEYSEVVPGTPKIEYKNPNNHIYEYATVNDPSDISGAMTIIKDLFNFLTTDEFKLFMKRNNLAHTIMTDIKELRINKSDFSERWFRFELRYMFSDNFERAEGTFIETVDTTRTSP